MAMQQASSETEEQQSYTSAVYTHLCPFRAHTLHLSSKAQIRLMSGRKPYTSGWHGFHNYEPGCSTFILVNFNYLGKDGKVKHTVCFAKLNNIEHEGMERYLGFELTAQDCLVETCEVVIRTQQNVGNQSGSSADHKKAVEAD